MARFLFKTIWILLTVAIVAASIWAQGRVTRIKQDLSRIASRIAENRPRQLQSYTDGLQGLKALRADFDAMAHDINHNWLVRFAMVAGSGGSRNRPGPDQFKVLGEYILEAHQHLIREERVIAPMAAAERDISKVIFLLHDSIDRPGNRPDLIPWLLGRGEALKERLTTFLPLAIERLGQLREPVDEYPGRAAVIEALTALGENEKAMTGLKDLARMHGRQTGLSEALAYDLSLYRSARIVGHHSLGNGAARRLARLVVREYSQNPEICGEALKKMAVCARATGDETLAVTLIRKGQELISEGQPNWAELEKLRLGAKLQNDLITAPDELHTIPETEARLMPERFHGHVADAIRILMKNDLTIPRDEEAIRKAIRYCLQTSESYFRALDQWNHPKDYTRDKYLLN